MNRVWAIAGLAIRGAIRSRVVICLLLILVGVATALPLTVKGDGTHAGNIQITLNYTLGFATFILSLATLWSGCAAISQDIELKQIQLLVVKPAARFELWLGKWLGLAAMVALLLLVVGGTTYGLLRWRMGADFELLRTSILAARENVSPVPVNVDEAAAREFQLRQSRGELPVDMPPGNVLQAIHESLLRQAFTVPPGGTHRWTFHLGTPSPRITIRYRVAGSQRELARLEGIWSIGTRRVAGSSAPNAWTEVQMDTDGVADIELQFANSDPKGVTVLFEPAGGVQLLRPAGSFELNFARTLLILWAHLAFLAAVGVTAGALFSMPVASFIALYALILLRAGDYVSDLAKTSVLVPWHDTAGQAPGWIDHALRLFFRALSGLIAPLQSHDPLGILSTGQLVSWTWVAHDLGLKVVVYGGILSLVGTYILNRREVALPT